MKLLSLAVRSVSVGRRMAFSLPDSIPPCLQALPRCRCCPQGTVFGGDGPIGPHRVPPHAHALPGWALSYGRLSVHPTWSTTDINPAFCVPEPGRESSRHLGTGHCRPARKPLVLWVCEKCVERFHGLSRQFWEGEGKNFVNFLEKKVSSLLWDSAAFQAPE